MIYVLGRGHLVYEDKIVDPSKTKCIVTESLPITDKIEGKIAVIVPNFETGELYYEYEDIEVIETKPAELSDQERIQQLESLVADMSELIIDMKFNGGIN